MRRDSQKLFDLITQQKGDAARAIVTEHLAYLAYLAYLAALADKLAG